MPISINELLQKVSEYFKREELLNFKGPVKLLEAYNYPFEPELGVYIISTSSNPESNENNIKFELDIQRLEEWRKTANKMRVNGQPANNESLTNELRRFWLPGENILYIGKASKTKSQSLRIRINQLLEHGGLKPGIPHKLGKSSPHKGGHWLYTLKKFPECYVYYLVLKDKISEIEVELRLLEEFIISTGCLDLFHLPWANRELKTHGFALRYEIPTGRKPYRIESQTI